VAPVAPVDRGAVIKRSTHVEELTSKKTSADVEGMW